IDAFHLEQNPARPDARDPSLGRALALAHAGFGRLPGEGLVGEDANPDAAAALDMAGQGDAGGFEGAGVDAASLERLESVVAERERESARLGAADAALHHLAPFNFFWCEHLTPSIRLRRRARAFRVCILAGENFAAENPDLYADLAVGRARFGKSVGHVRAQRLQRHATLAVPFLARDFRAAQAPRDVHLDALRAHPHRARYSFLHRAAKRDAALELERDILGHQLRIEVGAAHLVDIDKRVAPLHQLLDINLQLVDFRALLADHDTGARRVNVYFGLVGHPLDFNPRDAGVIEPLLDEVAQLQILVQQLRVVVARVPSGVPALDDAEAKPARMYFLSHMRPQDARSSTITVRWLVRLWIGVACMCARVSDRFQVGPVSAVARFTNNLSSSTFC